MKNTLLLLFLVVLLGGCSSFGRSPRTDFYMLSSPEEAHFSGNQNLMTGPRVAIGPVTIPGYLDRPQIFVRENNKVTIELKDFSQWSEPLANGVTRVLCDAVTLSLHPRNGLAFPLRAALQSQWRLSIDIGRLDGAPGEEVTLDAIWNLNDNQGNTLRSGRFTRSMPAGNDLADMVEAQSRLLADFGKQLGAIIP